MNKIGFVIMQIGNKELDNLYNDCISPVLIEAGYEPKRVDKHNDGELLKPKIIEFISEASIIVADLTNERPNCYLEVGYAMGLGKYRNLILTAREDHYHGSSNYKSGGHRIHFDLSGYEILFWSTKNKAEFTTKLLKIIKRRTYITQPTKNTFDTNWFNERKKLALEGLNKQKLFGYMTMTCVLIDGQYGYNQIELRYAARKAPINTFGWPIGVFLETAEYKPKPVNDGIIAEVATPESEWGKTYDYWAIRSDASFFLLQSLFEDTRGTKLLFFDTRIIRVAESLLYLARLYNQLKIDTSTHVHIKIEHGGLNGRILKAAGNRIIITQRNASQDNTSSEIDTTIADLDSQIIDNVENMTKNLFVNFDYFEVTRNIVEEIVTNFINGKIN